MLNPRGFVLCKMLHHKPLRKPLSKGDRLSDLLNSRAMLDLLFPSKPSQGRLFPSHSVKVTATVASIVEVQLTLLAIARSPGAKTRGKAQTRITRTRTKSKPSRLDKDGSTSPPLQNFQKAHRLCRVHSLPTTSLQLSYLIPVHPIVLLAKSFSGVHSSGLRVCRCFSG